LISFQLRANGDTFTFDPNRIFTPAGIISTLQDYGPYTPDAGRAVSRFAALLLQVYKFDEKKVSSLLQYNPTHIPNPFVTIQIVVALHNNSPNYSAASYLPGGPFQKDASAVYINPATDPRNFFYVTETSSFNYLKV